MGKIRVVSAIALVAVLLWCTTVMANGIIVPRPRPVPPLEPLRPANVVSARVDAKIDDQAACTVVEEVFENPNPFPLEGEFIFPLPPDAAVSEFSFWIDGKEMKGELLDAEKARGIYQDIVRSMKDPALLEYVGMKLFKISIFPIPPRAESKVKLTYVEVLKNDAGLCMYRYPHSTNKFSSRPLQKAVISIDLKSKVPIKSIYSPSHKVDVVKKDDNSAKISYEESNIIPDKDFILYYTLTDKDFGLNFLTFRRASQDGYFMALLSPKQEVAKTDVVSKDLIFVLDTSGSMQEQGKIEQAKKALEFCVSSLSEGDRFNIVSFATETRNFTGELQNVTKENVESARTFIKDLTARGGTNINDSLISALKMFPKSEKSPMVVFITDGEPTIGIVDPKSILENVKKANTSNIRIFVFGVGYDVNTHLLDKLAEENRGARDYITPAENIEVKISNFYDKIANPVLSDVKLAFDGTDVYDMSPSVLPDLFKGSQLAIVGRYKGQGHKVVRLKGNVAGKEKEFVYEANFKETDDSSDYIPRLWAISRIGYLLDQIRLSGEKAELKDEVVRLAKEFGILTPYTSYLVVEDLDRRRLAGRSESAAPGLAGGGEVARRLSSDRERLKEQEQGAKEKKGESAVAASKAIGEMKKPAQGAADTPESLDKAVRDVVKYVGEKTFYALESGAWCDQEYRKEMQTTKVKYFSDEYFDLMNKNPKLARYFSIGKSVIVVFEGKAYEVTE
jgi:Ca-activated chloride channel family protein